MLAWLIRLNPVHYGVEVLRAGFYAPAASPLPGPGLGLSLAVAGGFAVGMLAWAVATARRPVYG